MFDMPPAFAPPSAPPSIGFAWANGLAFALALALALVLALFIPLNKDAHGLFAVVFGTDEEDVFELVPMNNPQCNYYA